MGPPYREQNDAAAPAADGVHGPLDRLIIKGPDRMDTTQPELPGSADTANSQTTANSQKPDHAHPSKANNATAPLKIQIKPEIDSLSRHFRMAPATPAIALSC